MLRTSAKWDIEATIFPDKSKEIEDIINLYLQENSIKAELNLTVFSGNYIYLGRKIIVNANNSVWTLYIGKEIFKKANTRISLATNIAHELTHLKYQDLVYRGDLCCEFGLILSALAECRADLEARVFSERYYNGYSFDWVEKKIEPMNNGYLDYDARIAVAKKENPEFTEKAKEEILKYVVEKNYSMNIFKQRIKIIRSKKGKQEKWINELLPKNFNVE